MDPDFSLGLSLVKFPRLGNILGMQEVIGTEMGVARGDGHCRLWWGGKGEASFDRSSDLNFLQMLKCKCNITIRASEYFVLRPLLNLIDATFTS